MLLRFFEMGAISSVLRCVDVLGVTCPEVSARGDCFVIQHLSSSSIAKTAAKDGVIDRVAIDECGMR
jgi:hypothetical protein